MGRRESLAWNAAGGSRAGRAALFPVEKQRTSEHIWKRTRAAVKTKKWEASGASPTIQYLHSNACKRDNEARTCAVGARQRARPVRAGARALGLAGAGGGAHMIVQKSTVCTTCIGSVTRLRAVNQAVMLYMPRPLSRRSSSRSRSQIVTAVKPVGLGDTHSGAGVGAWQQS